MGADGGVVYIPLRKKTEANYNRVLELLKPFWQFLCTNDCSNVGQDANWEWQQNNSINPPEYILGYYGTDRVDNLDLFNLKELCNVDFNQPDELYKLTFDELDLECRTSIVPINGGYWDHILHNLWYQHFEYCSREEVLIALGDLSNVLILDWVKELNNLLCMNNVIQEETWT